MYVPVILNVYKQKNPLLRGLIEPEAFHFNSTIFLVLMYSPACI